MNEVKSKVLFVLFIIGISFSFKTFTQKVRLPDWDMNTYVYEALAELNDEKPTFYIDQLDPDKVRMGKDLVFHGRTTKVNGSKSKYISLYYVCTNCHNTVIEDPILTVSDPETRLTFALKNDLPFLQGTTFYGINNREQWYNDDYYKKYGDLVKPAQKDVRAAIQLCAKECSKGRYLESWEEEAILQYYYSISYKFSDIGFDETQIQEMNRRKQNPEDQKALIDNIKSRYLLKSPAHWLEPPYEQVSQLPKGKPDNGKLIYELSCQYCHKAYGVSDVVFENSKVQFKKFEKNFDKNYWWLYSIIRHGTYGYPGHEPYMPLYTAERMSNQQVEDLKAYFIQKANNE